ncbi:hypothetical protein F4859DRAFT_383840 [Xylaria cf. heliscus]|nr:hypothetical protein F4859DRAFT_383840 [Xylaria cf. heliscus]
MELSADCVCMLYVCMNMKPLDEIARPPVKIEMKRVRCKQAGRQASCSREWFVPNLATPDLASNQAISCQFGRYIDSESRISPGPHPPSVLNFGITYLYIVYSNSKYRIARNAKSWGSLVLLSYSGSMALSALVARPISALEFAPFLTHLNYHD